MQFLLILDKYLNSYGYIYRVFQDFESPNSLNLCHCKQLRLPDCGLFNSTVLRD